MAKKKNSSARQIDLTSYTFVKTCGGCHPGGGPAEFDRAGHRYDLFASDPSNHIVPGGDNNFDGDYYRAKWAESGVLEADCLMCHMPGYEYSKRKKQIGALNFRWAATAGAGLAQVTGSVSRNQTPEVQYDLGKFRKDGKVALHMVREIPTENCLHCHREPDWKKKGASYKPRTDVHIRAGIRCVDCHVTGRNAKDPRIKGRERHQIGKGDDPTGLVRNDLDNTMRTCEDCHFKGELRTKIASHHGLPPIHLEKIACLTCHVPQRQVKAALMQDSTVFNTVPRISKAGKRIWTFYGPDMKPWNLYGEASTFTVEKQPLFLFDPLRAWYKSKIFPMNMIDSIWIAIIDQDGRITGQPYMKDLYAMWTSHLKSPEEKWPELAVISDDNHDGAPEVNRPEEVLALRKAVRGFLEAAGEPMSGRKVALVSGPRYTLDGRTWHELQFKPEPWQYTPYSSVFKLSHDIMPADSALGAGGCTDCHSISSRLWNRKVMSLPFDGPGAETRWTTNAAILGLSPLGVNMGAIRHEILEPILFYGMLTVFTLLITILLARGLEFAPDCGNALAGDPAMRLMLAILGVAALGPGIILTGEKILSSDAVGILGTFHKAVGLILVASAVWVIVMEKVKKGLLFYLGCAGILFMAATGGSLLFSADMNLRQIVFTLHDMGALALCFMAAAAILVKIFKLRKIKEKELCKK